MTRDLHLSVRAGDALTWLPVTLLSWVPQGEGRDPVIPLVFDSCHGSFVSVSHEFVSVSHLAKYLH